jgi:hypothetical protein
MAGFYSSSSRNGLSAAVFDALPFVQRVGQNRIPFHWRRLGKNRRQRRISQLVDGRRRNTGDGRQKTGSA